MLRKYTNMITVFTPTYNRAYILPTLYKSLQSQTVHNFEWLIVDDGSTDNTTELVHRWQTEQNVFPIRYYKTPNGGKHRAINVGVANANGEAFFIVDSDDSLPVNALENIQSVFKQITDDIRFAGVCGLRADPQTLKPLSSTFLLSQTLDCSMTDIRRKYHIRGDMAEVFKTSVLKRYPFPEFEGENFISEGAVWNKISQHYLLRYVPQVWYLCEYLPDGLTKNIRKKYRENPRGTTFVLNNSLENSQETFKCKLRTAVLYWRYLCMQKIGYQKAVWWTYLFWPFGVLVYLYDILRGR